MFKYPLIPEVPLAEEFRAVEDRILMLNGRPLGIASDFFTNVTLRDKELRGFALNFFTLIDCMNGNLINAAIFPMTYDILPDQIISLTKSDASKLWNVIKSKYIRLFELMDNKGYYGQMVNIFNETEIGVTQRLEGFELFMGNLPSSIEAEA